MKKLRFAPFCRVSTESQERRGESLRTQKAQITQAVEMLKGELISDPWKYSGQEHSTPDYEKKRLDALLKDSGKGLFDAIIVPDPSRWSRDNLKSKTGLEILKTNNIRFFVGTTEYDLFKPADVLFLGMSTEMNEFFAMEQARKSIENRIARAKRNIPVAGNLPYGRTYDKNTNQWGIDPEKQKQIELAAQMYLDGTGIPETAKMFNMNPASMWKTLTKRCGTQWEIRLRNKRLKIDETVTLTVPALLKPGVIQAIRAKAKANKTYSHGEIKHKYLLSRVIFCQECGYAMYGQTNHSGRQYYRHFKHGVRDCVDKSFWIPADRLEKVVFIHMFSLMGGDVVGLQKAMKKAIPNRDEINKLRADKKIFEAKYQKAANEEQNLIRAIAKGIVSDDSAKSTMDDIKERKALLQKEIDRIDPQIQDVPTDNQIEKRAKLAYRMLGEIFASPDHFKKMTYDHKKKLIKETLFAGKDPAGNRYGVYVKKGNEKGTFEYKILGDFISLVGKLKPGKIDISQFAKSDKSLEYLESLINEKLSKEALGKRHAHYDLGIYK